MSVSKEKHKHRHKKTSGKSFIILPVVYFIITYLILYLIFSPMLTTLSQATGMFFSDSEKKFSSEYNNIFVPVSESKENEDNEENSDKDESETVDISDIVYPKYGEMFGELIIDDCSVEAPLFLGDNSVALRNGVGIYYGSCIPGYGKTILVAGHNSTFFNGLKNAEKGQKIVIKTSYGNYEYKIKDIAVKRANDSSAYDLSADEENLILYTCYPFDELGLTSRRYFVYADYVSGPVINKNAQEVD